MKKYRGILFAAIAAVMLCACSGKSEEPAKEKTKENTEASVTPESRNAEIQILDETPAATEPETKAQDQILETTGAAGEEHAAGQAAGGTEASGTDAARENAVKETEAAKVYSVEAFEKTMYATANVNVRASYTTKSEVLTSLTPGQKVKVTGRSANGWMRVIYEGKDAFVYQKYLSDHVKKSGQSVTAPAQPGGDSSHSGVDSLLPGNSEPAPGVATYPGNPVEDPPASPGQIPIVEPAPVMTAPGQYGTDSSVTQYGPGVVSPGEGSSRSETVVPGTGPGM